MDEDSISPPPGPPPLLSDEEILALAKNGWLSVSLPRHLNQGLTLLSNTATEFFHRDNVEKAELYPKDQGTEKGFYPIENEKEYLTMRCRVHDESELESVAATVWKDTAAFLRRILHDLARGLDLPPDIWDSLLDGCLEFPPGANQMTPTLLRLFQYYPGSGFASVHNDMGLLTLCVGEGRGLQVFGRTPDQSGWLDANGPTVLIGETLRILSYQRVLAGSHRVVENPNGRSSIVFALRPSLRHMVDGRFGVGDTLQSKDLWNKIKNSKWNINATPDVRKLGRDEIQQGKRTS